MAKMKWHFGSLTSSQEKDFIYRRIQGLPKDSAPLQVRVALTEVVSAAHEAMRSFAERNILADLRKKQNGDCGAGSDIEKEAKERARSIVSLRDIQRVFALFSFFYEDLEKDFERGTLSTADRSRRAMLLAIATVYYLRLDGASRLEFLSMLDRLPTEAGQRLDLLSVLNDAMTTVIASTDIPPGIAVTRGLKENVFVTLVCTLSQTPLIIVGPPGSSKTLAVHIVGDNANGSDSLSPFYSRRPRLSLFHYQCSKQSTSKEISAVFDQAIQRQERVAPATHRCVVFMDEAGLPEEEKESLKVLHYLLESRMSAKAKVGFVAISNHVLDAAKSNRCVMLLRQELDDEEMLAIAIGVLFDFREDGRACAHDVDLGGALISAADFAARFCRSYASMFAGDSQLSQLETFFGLRDFIYLLKALRSNSTLEGTRLVTCIKKIVYAIERNFNGITAPELQKVTAHFLAPLMHLSPLPNGTMESLFRDPLVVLKDALCSATPTAQLNRARFKLVIDCTEDDSILRLLSKGNVTDVSRRSLFKLSGLSEDVELECLRLVSGVKFAAMQGNFAVLSQTESVNESFYDLFNQRFREIKSREGSLTLYANIAVGGISRRSLVSPVFECVIHIRESNMFQIPAPFLNRFEKYRLGLSDVLRSSWKKFGALAGIVTNAKRRTSEIASTFKSVNGTLGWMDDQQTLESIFVDMLPHVDGRIWDSARGDELEPFRETPNLFQAALVHFMENFTSLPESAFLIEQTINTALCSFGTRSGGLLERLLQEEPKECSMLECSKSILLARNDGPGLSKHFALMIQMAMTRAACFRMIQLATPESVFTNR
jgi:ATPase family associated with various cellular activities (AAA)